MNIYLIWNQKININKESISIFDLEISQEEGKFSKARLVVASDMLLPPTDTEALIQGENQEIFFKGVLVGAPLKSKGYFSEIELIARPSDFSEKLKLLQKESRVSPYWDELWVKAENRKDDQVIQGVRTASLYCDRRTGDLIWSDWFEGRNIVDLSQHVFQESLLVKRVRNPLKSCTVNVSAQWVQSEEGISNLAPAIRRVFPRHKMSTYTQKSLSGKWPESGKRLGRSGLWVVRSELKPMFPASRLYPRYSSPLLLGEEGEGDKPKSYRLERHWFKPTLWVGWRYQQKRKETLFLTLPHAFQSIMPGEGEHKILEFTLQNINPDLHVYVWRPETFYRKGAKVCYRQGIYRCKEAHQSDLSFSENLWTFKKMFHTPLGNPARASFFVTERGYEAAEHAMERAKVELAKSARSLEVSFEAPWEVLKDITTDTTVSLSAPSLPGGQVKGKVVKYALIAKGETGERFGQVTLLCALGVAQIEQINKKVKPTYVFEGYCEESYQVHKNGRKQTKTGLIYTRYDHKVPLEAHRMHPLLRAIELKNGPDEQESEIFSHSTSSGLKKALSQKSTKLKLFFNDLRTQDRVDCTIPVQMMPWSAPCQCLIAKN
jgi:hypothetical protein